MRAVAADVSRETRVHAGAKQRHTAVIATPQQLTRRR